MGVLITDGNNSFIKFKGTTLIDDFGGVVYDARIMRGDIVLWNFNDPNGNAGYMISYTVDWGVINFLTTMVLLSAPCYITFIVLDGNKIPN